MLQIRFCSRSSIQNAQLPVLFLRPPYGRREIPTAALRPKYGRRRAAVGPPQNAQLPILLLRSPYGSRVLSPKFEFRRTAAAANVSATVSGRRNSAIDAGISKFIFCSGRTAAVANMSEALALSKASDHKVNNFIENVSEKNQCPYEIVKPIVKPCV